MKIRLAKKIMFSRMYFKKRKKMRPNYFDEERGCWVTPSCADMPDVIRARTRYYKWVGVFKKQNKK